VGRGALVGTDAASAHVASDRSRRAGHAPGCCRRMAARRVPGRGGHGPAPAGGHRSAVDAGPGAGLAPGRLPPARGGPRTGGTPAERPARGRALPLRGRAMAPHGGDLHQGRWRRRAQRVVLSTPVSAARVATPARLRAPSLVMMRLTRSLTVCTLRWTRSEISWLE